jgi:hypothetical protein
MRTALAYLETLSMVSEADEDTGDSGDTATEKALDKAREAFDGTYQREGEWARSAYLQRAFESFDDVALDLPRWAEALYGGLMGRVRLGTFEADAVAGQGVGA